MDPPAPTRPAAATLEGPVPAARRLVAASVSPNTRRGLYRGAPPPSTPGSPAGVSRTRRSPATWPSSTSRGELPRARRWRWPRRVSGPASSASRARPGNAPPGCWRATGGPGSAAAGARRAPSWRRTWPRSSPPATSRDAAAAAWSCDEVALKRGQLDAVIAGAAVHGGAAAERGERPAVGRRRSRGRRRRDAGDGPPREDEPGGRGAGRAGS